MKIAAGVTALAGGVLAAGLAVGSAGAAVPGSVCVRGTLAFDAVDSETAGKPLVTSVARNANWELWGRATASGPESRLATGLTSSKDGTFDACHTTARQPMAQLRVKFLSSSTKTWRVVSDAQSLQEYSFFSVTRPGSAAVQNVGTVKVPTDMALAWKTVDTTNKLWWKRANTQTPCWTRNEAAGQCTQLTYVWKNDGKKGSWWDGGTGYVHLAGLDPRSQHLVLHEAGHFFMGRLYKGNAPYVTNCATHPMGRRTSATCALWEGFPDAVAAYAMGDRRYVYSDSSSVDFDKPTGWETGDQVEGRVVGALLDLWAKGGPDGGSWDRTIDAMVTSHPGTFRDYWLTARPEAGLPVTGQARSIIENRTIRY
ncbi:metalloprotease [Streptomyces sp. WM6368]|uniref:metalloprotease n=1 Tax=Streptomyces sp. WM6368 TaxID=1415554 RepID=UPI001F489FEF|nr:metalloprotease [Streptomyces sp. WM6368]